MSNRHRLGIVALLASLVFALVVTAAVAQEEEGETTEPAVTVDDGGAAVPVPPEEIAEEEKPWTARYLPQLLVLLTVLVVWGIAAYYFIRIRGRYEVIPG